MEHMLKGMRVHSPYRRHVESGTWIEYHSLTIVDWMTAL